MSDRPDRYALALTDACPTCDRALPPGTPCPGCSGDAVMRRRPVRARRPKPERRTKIMSDLAQGRKPPRNRRRRP